MSWYGESGIDLAQFSRSEFDILQIFGSIVRQGHQTILYCHIHVFHIISQISAFLSPHKLLSMKHPLQSSNLCEAETVYHKQVDRCKEHWSHSQYVSNRIHDVAISM